MTEHELTGAIAECESSGRILKNLIRHLKESSFRGSFAGELAEGIGYLSFLEKQVGVQREEFLTQRRDLKKAMKEEAQAPTAETAGPANEESK